MDEFEVGPSNPKELAKPPPGRVAGSGRVGSSTAVARLKTLGPWAIAAGILYYLFADASIAEAWDAARSARLELFLPAMLSVVFFWFLIDSTAFSFLFTRYNAFLSGAEARSLRGMTYLLTPINWNLGTAAVILHLRTSKNIGALDSTSTMMLYQTIDGILLAGYVVLGVVLLADSPETQSLRNIALGFVCFQLISLIVFMGKRPSWEWLERLRSRGFFRSFQMATPGDIGVLLGLKALYFAAWIGIYWLGCQSFGIELPLRLAIAATPAILLVGALPITPAGLGTQQAAMLYFFSPYGEEAAILAFGLTFPVALILFRCMIGLRYMSDLPKLRRAVAVEAG